MKRTISNQDFFIRDDVSVHGWPGTMGGITRRVHDPPEQKSGYKILLKGGDPSFISRIARNNLWPKYATWYNQILTDMGILGDETTTKVLKPCEHDVRDNDISLLPTSEATHDPILRAFEATTRSDSLTNKRIIVNPDIEMTDHLGIHLTYRCFTNCEFFRTLDVPFEDLISFAFRDGHCKFRAEQCTRCGTREFIVTAGSRAVVNWYKVLTTVDNDLNRIRAFLGTKATEVDSWVPHSIDMGKDGVFNGNIHPSLLKEEFLEEIVQGLHRQYKYSMLGIIIAVSDPGKPLDLPSDMTGFANPVEHWHKKRHQMTDLWWNKIKAMLTTTPDCEKECAICSRYSGEDWHDVAPHISHCDVYGRLHADTDIYSLSWVERMMVTASYWDELGNKDPLEVAKAKCSIGRACIDVALGRDGDFDQRMAKQRALLNLNTYTLRRTLNESRYLAATGLGSFKVGNFSYIAQMVRGRLFEGMTLPYVEDDMIRRSCSKCADMIVLAGQLGIVFHDAIDLPNDIFNCEYMNVYRMAASGGLEALIKFTKGAHTLLRVMASVGSKSLCCGRVLQAALSNTVSWYFYCARYNYASNVQLVFNNGSDYHWDLSPDLEAAVWVGHLLGCNERTLEYIKEWLHLPLTSHNDWGCGNKNPIRRFKIMRAATFDRQIVNAEEAETESAEVFCTLASAGRQHICGEWGKCLCCEITYECVELSILGEMVGRFVHHALRLGTGKIAMVIDC